MHWMPNSSSVIIDHERNQLTLDFLRRMGA